MDGASIENKVNLLFKEANNTVDVVRFEPFTNPQNAYPFQNYVQNDEIFSNNIPPDLSNITFTVGSTTFYGSQALDISLSLAGQTDPSQIQITPDLVYNYRIPLERASTQLSGAAPKRTWYVPDPNNPSRSLLSDSIAFNYDTIYNSYMPSLVDMCGNNQNPYYSGNVGAIWWRMDYKSGFVQLYGSDSNVDAFIPTINDAPRLSFIQYTGPKGAGIGGVVNGEDASFNNVDISDNLTVKNLTVTHSANLPEETLIVPKWDDIQGSNDRVPVFPAGYPKTEQVKSFVLDPSTNLVTDQDWVTIAYCAENEPIRTTDARADAMFKINYPRSSAHDTITFQASSKYGRGNGINVFQNDWFSNTQGAFDAIRIMTTNNIYDGAVLQVRFKNPPSDGKGGAFTVRVWDNYDYPGWTIYNNSTPNPTIGEPPIVQKDNNPVSQFERYNKSKVNIGYVTLNQQYLIDELNWNDANENVNQVTRNPAFFQNIVRIDDDVNINGELFANNGITTTKLEASDIFIGQVPNQIVNTTDLFYLSTSISTGDWISIARVGDIQTTTFTNNNNRAFGVISVFDQHTNNNQHIQITAGVMLKEGCVLEAITTGQLDPDNTGEVFTAVRIVMADNNDGAILQIQVGSKAMKGSSRPYRTTLTNGQNDPGWKLIDGTLTNDSDPIIYTGTKASTSTTYSSITTDWVTIPLNYAPNTSGKSKEVGKITNIPTKMQDARFEVFGENILCQKDSDGGEIKSIDGVITVSDVNNNNDLTMKLDSTGNGILSNTDSANGKNISIESNGSILFDNRSSSASNSGVVTHSKDGIYVQANNSSNSSNIYLKTFGTNPNIRFTVDEGTSTASGNKHDLKWTKDGLDLGNEDIYDIDAILGNNSRTNDMIIRADNRSILSYSKNVTFESPLRVLNANTSNCKTCMTGRPASTMIYDTTINQFIYSDNSRLKVISTPQTVTLWDTVSVFSGGPPTYIDTSTKIGNLNVYTKGQTYRNGKWPDANQITPGSITRPYPISSYNAFIYDDFRAAHDGYITHAEWGGTAMHRKTNPSSQPIFKIYRPGATYGAPSTLTLQLQTIGSSGTQTYNIGNILTGPNATPVNSAETDTSTETRWRFEVNPSTNYIPFKKDDKLTVRIKFNDGAGAYNNGSKNDRLTVQMYALSGSNVNLLNCDLTFVYTPTY